MLSRWAADGRLAAGLALIFLALVSVPVAHRSGQPSDGTVVQISDRPWRSDRLVVDRVLDRSTGLRAGDVVIAVDGRPLSLSAERSALVVSSPKSLTYTVVRGDSRFDIHVRLRPFSLLDFVLASWSALAVQIVFLLVASYVFLRRPGNAGAQDLLLIAAMMTSGTVGWLLGDPVAALAFGRPSFIHLFEELQLALLWGVVLHFLLIVSGRIRRGNISTYAACMGVPLMTYVVYLLLVLPTAANGREAMGRLVQVSLPVSATVPILCALLLTWLYVRALDEPTRKTLRLLLVTFAFAAIVWFAVWTVPEIFDRATVDTSYVPLIFLPALLAVVTAIVQQRLLDVEVVATRTVIYAGITTALLAAYVALVWALDAHWGASHPVGVLVASGLSAMFLPPLATRAGRRMNRLIFGMRSDPVALASTLDGIDGSIDPGTALSQITTLLTRSLRLGYAEITLVDADGNPTLSAHHGAGSSKLTVLPLSDGAREVGTMLLSVDGWREPFGQADTPTLQILQRQIGALAANVQLTQELLQSRDRIVRAREEERRQLHHRLHDGVGSSLATGSMQLQVAQSLVRTDPAKAEATLGHVHGQMTQLIADLRGLVYGLRPPALDEIGLPAAVRGRAEEFSLLVHSSRSLAIKVVDRGDFSDLPAAVEVAAYWIAVEATHNVVKHAQATRCVIELIRADVLDVYVDDDGCGAPVMPQPGGGLRSMSERAEEVGGTLTLTRSRYGGARLHARLPIGREVRS